MHLKSLKGHSHFSVNFCFWINGNIMVKNTEAKGLGYMEIQF